MFHTADYAVHLLQLGTFAMDGGAVFGVIPKALWQQQIKPDDHNRVPMALRSLLIVGGQRRILVDTGIGDCLNAKMKRLYRVNSSADQLGNVLQQLGCNPAEITDVIITHLHFDHVGGAVQRGTAQRQPLFPQATYYVQRRNYEWALSPSVLDRTSYMRDNFIPLEKSGQLQLIDGEKELFPGIELFVSHGHTPGQQMVLIRDRDKPLFFCADLCPSALHIPTTWISAFDLYPLTLIKEKEHIFVQAVRHNWQLIFPHDTEIKAATLKQGPRYFKIKTSISLEN